MTSSNIRTMNVRNSDHASPRTRPGAAALWLQALLSAVLLSGCGTGPEVEAVTAEEGAVATAEKSDNVGPCGTKEGRLDRRLNRFVIPDYFPPDSSVVRAAFEAMTSFTAGRCENLFGRASFKSACEEHDRCYETRGSSKHGCDAALQDGWVRECEAHYANRCLTRFNGHCVVGSPDNPLRDGCKAACSAFARLMSEAQRINIRGSCLSCDAYNRAQGR